PAPQKDRSREERDRDQVHGLEAKREPRRESPERDVRSARDVAGQSEVRRGAEKGDAGDVRTRFQSRKGHERNRGHAARGGEARGRIRSRRSAEQIDREEEG